MSKAPAPLAIMTEEYCRQCPWFHEKLGYLPAEHPHWKNTPDNKCVCRNCSRRFLCERDGPVDDILICYEHNRKYFETPGGV